MKYFITAFLLVSSFKFYAWDGYDYDTGEYKSYEVESITGYGSSAELEVYDYDSGEYRTLDMD